MLEEARHRLTRLQVKMSGAGVQTALFTDESSIAYLAGFWGYLGIEFGRPTMLVVHADRDPVIITPTMESEMVGSMTWVQDVRGWEDSGPRDWGNVIKEVVDERIEALWVEKNVIPAIVRNFLDEQYAKTELRCISTLLGEMRMIKSAAEIEVMKQAGRIAGAMMSAAHKSLAEGRQEYRSALAVIEAGTEAAAGFLTDKGWERFVSPMAHNLQIMQSGSDTSMVHRRANVRRYRKGDPVYFCFCNMVQFKQYKLGFDRMFHIGEISDDAAKVQQAAIDAQQAAIASIRPGVLAEDVAAAANEVYQVQGYETGYRTGRSIGVAFLEAPELKKGDKTVLRPGMTFAVDGGISIDGSHGGRIGDSVVVTESGCDYLTEYPRQLLITKE